MDGGRAWQQPISHPCSPVLTESPSHTTIFLQVVLYSVLQAFYESISLLLR